MKGILNGFQLILPYFPVEYQDFEIELLEHVAILYFQLLPFAHV